MAKKRVHRPEGSRPVSPAPRPARRAGPSAAARPSRRRRFEQASARALARMMGLPTFLVPITLAVLLFLGLVLPYRWAGILLVVIAAFLTWLTAVSWPAVSNGSRVLRVVINVSILVLGVLRLLGRL